MMMLSTYRIGQRARAYDLQLSKGRMTFVRSPDGISFELLQKGASLEPAEPWLSMPNVGVW